MTTSTFSLLCGLLILAVIASESTAQSSNECQEECAANERCKTIDSIATCKCIHGYEREILSTEESEPCRKKCRMNIYCNTDEYCTGKVCKPLSSDAETAKEQLSMARNFWASEGYDINIPFLIVNETKYE